MGDTDNWDTTLNEYQEKYISYLKKSVSDDENEKLKKEIETLNSQLENMVRTKDTNNDDLIKEIEIKKGDINVALAKCKKKRNNQRYAFSNKTF